MLNEQPAKPNEKYINELIHIQKQQQLARSNSVGTKNFGFEAPDVKARVTMNPPQSAKQPQIVQSPTYA